MGGSASCHHRCRVKIGEIHISQLDKIVNGHVRGFVSIVVAQIRVVDEKSYPFGLRCGEARLSVNKKRQRICDKIVPCGIERITLSWLPRLELDRKQLFRRKPGGQSSDFYEGIGSSTALFIHTRGRQEQAPEISFS